jgi:hypothetical protein
MLSVDRAFGHEPRAGAYAGSRPEHLSGALGTTRLPTTWFDPLDLGHRSTDGALHTVSPVRLNSLPAAVALLVAQHASKTGVAFLIQVVSLLNSCNAAARAIGVLPAPART